MSAPNPHPWSCSACQATDRFVITVDRVLHVTKNHVASVVDALGNVLVFDSPGAVLG